MYLKSSSKKLFVQTLNEVKLYLQFLFMQITYKFYVIFFFSGITVNEMKRSEEDRKSSSRRARMKNLYMIFYVSFLSTFFVVVFLACANCTRRCRCKTTAWLCETLFLAWQLPRINDTKFSWNINIDFGNLFVMKTNNF